MWRIPTWLKVMQISTRKPQETAVRTCESISKNRTCICVRLYVLQLN